MRGRDRGENESQRGRGRSGGDRVGVGVSKKGGVPRAGGSLCAKRRGGSGGGDLNQLQLFFPTSEKGN